MRKLIKDIIAKQAKQEKKEIKRQAAAEKELSIIESAELAEIRQSNPKAKLGSGKRARKYETIRVKVPLDRKILNFTSAQLIELFGGWFTLTYAFSIPNGSILEDGKLGMTDFYICSRDVSPLLPSERPAKNAVIKKLFDKDVYGYALIAPSNMFGGNE